MEIKIERLEIFLLPARRKLPNQEEKGECFYRDDVLQSALDTCSSRGVQKPEQQLREKMRACCFSIILH